jgi:hypothetical protein
MITILLIAYLALPIGCLIHFPIVPNVRYTHYGDFKDENYMPNIEPMGLALGV